MQITDINGNIRECESVVPDPDYPGFLKVTFKNERGSHFEWLSVSEFEAKNPKLSKSLKANIPPPQLEDLGRVSKSSEDSLTDNTKSWEKNIFTGLPVWISRGTGESQVRTVTGNTKHTIKIDENWKVLPDKTSQYVISPNIHHPHAFGNTLPVELTKKGRKPKIKS